MKFKSLLLSAALAISATAHADPVISLPGGPLYLKFDNREQIAINGANTGFAGESNWGLLTVSSINQGIVTDTNTIGPVGAAFFNNISSHNAQITGIFYGISALPAGTGGNPFPATGGFIDLYWRDLDLLSTTTLSTALPTVRTSQSTATGFTEGNFLVRLAFASGINTTDGSVFINGSVVPSSGSGYLGVATSYANVDTSAVGAYTSNLDTDFFTTPFGSRDVRFRNVYEELPSWNGGPNILGAFSTDPAMLNSIPEPATLALVGLALLAAGAVRRKS